MTGEKLFIGEKLRFLLKEFRFMKSLKFGEAWQTLSLSGMLHKIFNDFILSAMLLHQWYNRLSNILLSSLAECRFDDVILTSM